MSSCRRRGRYQCGGELGGVNPALLVNPDDRGLRAVPFAVADGVQHA